MTRLIISAILLLAYPLNSSLKTLDTSTVITIPEDENFDNNIIDFDEEYTVKFNKKYGAMPWHANDFNKNAHKYTIIKDEIKNNNSNVSYNPNNTRNNYEIRDDTTTENYKVIPLELVSTTEDALVSIIESTTEQDLTVIPLYTTHKIPNITIELTVTLPTTTDNDATTEDSETTTIFYKVNGKETNSSDELTTTWEPLHLQTPNLTSSIINDTKTSNHTISTDEKIIKITDTSALNLTKILKDRFDNIHIPNQNITTQLNHTKIASIIGVKAENKNMSDNDREDTDVPVFTELDTEDLEDIPEDYYDSKDILPTSAPKTDALSVLFGLAGSVVESVVESVAERVVPKSIYDLFKRMQRQNEALEAERLRSREENGGIGQFGRGILKSLSTGLSKPLSQLMAGVKEAGSLDTDRGFVGSVASGVTSVANAANSYIDAFKDKVQAIYPGTVWCGDGHSAQARSSSDLGLFFFTDTCCRQHDACKIYIKAGETKYGLTNTGLFTRSHCSCDTKFRECLRRTSSLVSAQIGLTYFNVLGPQCFRRAHPIVKCGRRTRLTGQKCEEYELDYTKPRMWQWFDNETF